jgi:hypothetical protein
MREPCALCEDMRGGVPIRSPGELLRAIAVLREKLSRGWLIEIASPGAEPFADLRAEGPWPDLIEHNFRCADCAGRYRLAVNTHHGRGVLLAVDS